MKHKFEVGEWYACLNDRGECAHVVIVEEINPVRQTIRVRERLSGLRMSTYLRYSFEFGEEWFFTSLGRCYPSRMRSGMHLMRLYHEHKCHQEQETILESASAG